MVKKKVLLVEDTTSIAKKIFVGLQNTEIYEPSWVHSLEQFRDIMKNKNDFDIGIFDIRLIDSEESNIDGIIAGEEFNKEKMRPTLFITAYDNSQYYWEQTHQRVPHSAYRSKTGENYVDNIIKSIDMALDLFHQNFPGSLLIYDRITLSPYQNPKERIIIHKDELLFIIRYKDRNYFVTTKHIYPHSASLNFIGEQIAKYEDKGWFFRRISGSCIVNLEKIIGYCRGDIPVVKIQADELLCYKEFKDIFKESIMVTEIEQKPEKILHLRTGTDFLESNFSEWFPSIYVRNEN